MLRYKSPIFYKPLHDIIICFLLLRVIQLLQRICDAAALKRIFQEIVTDMRVLRKERTVQVSADDILVQHPLLLVFTVVSVSEDHGSEGFHPFSQIGSSAMIFKPNYFCFNITNFYFSNNNCRTSL